MVLMARSVYTLPILMLCAVVTASCDGSTTTGSNGHTSRQLPVVDDIDLVEVADGLSAPVHLTAPDGDDRLFVVEKQGRIKIVEGGKVLATHFLDISALVSNGGEQGLLSLAFHPDYSTNGYFYVYHTDVGGDTRVVRYTVSGDPNLADPTSAKLILAVAQPYTNHNGGLISFGPDGMLYVGLGDGGSGGDPDNNGQNLGTLLGSILRIDVDGSDPYAIPSDNPFVDDASALDEIWAYGLRNPWRYAFDVVDGVIYIADVGQNSWEEINAESATQGGVNYGWRIMEGTSCYNPSDCSSSGLTQPIVQYANGVDGCAVVGGYAYRGAAISGRDGTYFYSDNCSGWIRSFLLDSGEPTEETEWDVGNIGGVLSFGEDGFGELYVLTVRGTVLQFVPAS
jgi:glucose/arabinose dehydrogenase